MFGQGPLRQGLLRQGLLRQGLLRQRLALLSLVACTACLDVGPEFPDREPAEMMQAATLQPADAQTTLLRVMSYNIKFGGARIDFFFDGWGERVHMSRAEVETNLDGLLALIAEVGPDVLLLQEVDRDSRRSAFVDQAQYILDHSKLNYGAYAHAWRSHFVPDHGIGQVDMGVMVMSRFPLAAGERIDQGTIDEQDPVTQRFYLRRAMVKTVVQLSGDRRIPVIAVHTAAYATDGTKKRQIEQIRAEAEATEGPVIVGGDFNALPPGAVKREGFADERPVLTAEPVHYRGEEDWMQGMYDLLKPAIPLADYQADEARYFSASVNKDVFWTRRLDYLFCRDPWSAGANVLQKPGDLWLGKPIAADPMQLSDHAPVVALLPLQ